MKERFTMLHTQTTDQLLTLRLEGMASALEEQRRSASYQALSFEDRLAMLVQREIEDRDNRRLTRLLKLSKLRNNAVIEDVDYASSRGLERSQVLSLAQSSWVQHHHSVAIVGPTGVGKTFLGCALANAAIRHGYSALYLRAPRMLDDLVIARADGRLAKLMSSWARTDVLLIDDFLIRSLSPDQAADTLEVIEDRTGRRSTIITSQLPVAHWHEAMGDETLADAILDRLSHNLHRIELKGDSMRTSDAPAAQLD
jgi:DNA replication protein DnaC